MARAGQGAMVFHRVAEIILYPVFRCSVWKMLDIFHCEVALCLVRLSSRRIWLGCNLWGTGWRHLNAVRARALWKCCRDHWDTVAILRNLLYLIKGPQRFVQPRVVNFSSVAILTVLTWGQLRSFAWPAQANKWLWSIIAVTCDHCSSGDLSGCTHA